MHDKNYSQPNRHRSFEIFGFIYYRELFAYARSYDRICLIFQETTKD